MVENKALKALGDIIKRDYSYRYKEDAFREKVDKVLEQTPELRKMTIHVGALSLEDM